MREHPTTGRLLVGLVVMFLVGGCAAGATPSVTKISDIAYELSNPLLLPGVLDVYAPATAGPWPVVVMFHGAPSGVSTKSDYRDHARKVADLGFVVFVPDWGHVPGGGAWEFTYDGQLAVNSQAAVIPNLEQLLAVGLLPVERALVRGLVPELSERDLE